MYAKHGLRLEAALRGQEAREAEPPATIAAMQAAAARRLVAHSSLGGGTSWQLMPAPARLSPPAVSDFQLLPGRIGAEIGVAGYSYEDRRPAPVLTFGALEDSVGLNGEAGLKRLSLQALPGDAGGPVVDGSGAVVGLLLPAAQDATKELPAGVAFADSSTTVTAFLKGAGLTTREAGRPEGRAKTAPAPHAPRTTGAPTPHPRTGTHGR